MKNCRVEVCALSTYRTHERDADGMPRQGGTLTRIVGSQLPNVFIIPRTVNLKYKDNDRLLSCYYLQRCTSLRINNSMTIFVFFFGCNKYRGHIALTIIT